jgi:hypothetical protein
LDFGSGKIVASRSRYLTLLHGNVAAFRFDGTNWQPLVLCLDTIWVDGGAPTITATTTNPAKGTTARDVIYWRRIGAGLEFVYQYKQTASGSDGNGTYRVALPFAPWSAAVPSSDDLSESSTASDAWALSTIGTGGMTNNALFAIANAILASASTFAVHRVTDSGRSRWGSDNYSLGGSVIRVAIRGSYPVQYW